MFGLGYSGTASSVDPEKERFAPPPPTLVYFPQNDLVFESRESWLSHPPELFFTYAHISKTTELHIDHLNALNLTVKNDIELEQLIPLESDGTSHLPEKPSLAASSRFGSVKSSGLFSQHKHALLSNGIKAPDLDLFEKFMREVACETEDGLRAIGRRKPRPGHKVAAFNYFRQFWSHLEIVSQYWNTSRDHYYDKDAREAQGGKRLSIQLGSHPRANETQKAKQRTRYTGWRVSTGAKMPEHYRIDAVRSFVSTVTEVFGCKSLGPKRLQNLEIKSLMIPVTQSAMVWRTPLDKAQIKDGYLDGPVIGLQCRAETNFVHDPHAPVIDAARELSALLMLAQERAREGKPKRVPGEGRWYTSKPRWGGGPGGEFGEAVGNKDTKLHGHLHFKRHSAPAREINANEEERIWRELRPGQGLWEPRTTYLAVGKDRTLGYDNVFMISALYHHISILRLTVHPLYIDFLETGKVAKHHPDQSWWKPVVSRSRWFDLLDAEDRVEALRGIWGVMSYLMRTDGVSREQSLRQHSDASHVLLFKGSRTKQMTTEQTARANSVF